MIHLFDQFYLDADEEQFILIEWDGSISNVDKNGNRTNMYKSRHYYSDFNHVITKLATMGQRRSIASSSSLSEMIEKFEQTKKSIEDLTRRMWPTIHDVSEGTQKPSEGVPYDLDI